MIAVRPATADDAADLAHVAAATFPLACPPGTSPLDIAAFVGEHLTAERMNGYLSEPDRELFVATLEGVVVGYTMLVHEQPSDPDVATALTAHPTAELSKCYVLPSAHGRGVAAALVAATLDAAAERGAAGVWLGVNQLNGRANAFYEKCGFRVVGEKRFLVGAEWHDDFTRERAFAAHA